MTSENIKGVIDMLVNNDELIKEMSSLKGDNFVAHIKKNMKNKGMDCSDDELVDALEIFHSVHESIMHKSDAFLNEDDLGLSESKKSSLEVATKFREGLIRDLESVHKAYDKVMVMYTIAFYLGVFLIGFSLYSAVFLKNDILTILTGVLGTADIVTSFIYRPAQELQNSRGNLVQLKCAFFNWLNDLNCWNVYLNRAGRNKDNVSYDEVKNVSKTMLENLSVIMELIEKYAIYKHTDKKQK